MVSVVVEFEDAVASFVESARLPEFSAEVEPVEQFTQFSRF